MNDIDRLETNIVDLQRAVYLISDRLSVQSQDMAALRKRIEALETEAQGVGSSHCIDCGKAWSVVQVCCDQGVSGEGRHVLGRCVTCCPCRFKTKAPASPAPPAPLVERICLIFHKQQSPTYPARCEMAKEALLVAAEELLGPVTDEEWEAVCIRCPSEVRIPALCSDIMCARLARAKEAAK